MKLQIVIERNTDPIYHPYTVSVPSMNLEFSGKNLRPLLCKLMDAVVESLGV